MYACPHCSALSISFWRKERSSLLFPARCPACHGESVPSVWNAFLAALAGELLLWGGLLFAAWLRSFWGLVSIPVAFLGLSLVLGALCSLVPIDRKATASRRTVRHVLWIIRMRPVIRVFPAAD